MRPGGLLLFLPVPVVLWLFTGQPLGSWASLGSGIVLMVTHRLYARPFALAGAGRRCLWCGGPAGEGPRVDVHEPSGRTSWRACGEEHAGSLARTLGWAVAHSRLLSVGILGTLALFLAGAVAAALGKPRWFEAGDAVALFRLGIALTVLPFGWRASGHGAADAAQGRLPFPVHIQALLGTVWVLWLFRLVGLWWLLAAALHFCRRLA
ncbi:MAG TPA: hypothetical protein VMT70_20320 [Vicinamibacteria bacterium]|nr:hypothetical protein [Vicinamibacteria bacterium]